MIRTQSISLRTVIAETFERYKSMRVGQLKYIDSFQFMNHGLATLGENIGACSKKLTAITIFE
jgi:hypothetical protein